MLDDVGNREPLISLSPAEAASVTSAVMKSQLTSIVAVTGSGISAASGLSTFTSEGKAGLYERARKRFKLKDGMDLFQWKFYAERPYDAMQFLGDMCSQARTCDPTSTHQALYALERHGALRRHYTMNIDGLHGKVGMSTWGGDDGKTVELHGTLLDLVDVETGHVYDVDDRALNRIRKKLPAFEDTSKREPKRTIDLDTDDEEEPPPEEDDVPRAEPCRVRFRVMFYGDEEHACILDAGAALSLLRNDAAHAKLVLWLGISFQQSASCDYLRRIVNAAPVDTIHLVVNPSKEAAFNARSSLDHPAHIDLRAVYATSDDLFTALADAVPDLGLLLPLEAAAPDEGSSSPPVPVVPPPSPPPPSGDIPSPVVAEPVATR